MVRSTLSNLIGWQLKLRLVTPDDAAYIFGLRSDPNYNRHLSAVSGNVEDQRAWIEAYKEREALEQEFYYVVEKADAQPCGLIRIYDMTSDSFTWGSWIIDSHKTSKAALESLVLVYRAGFEVLGKKTGKFEVDLDNDHSLAFHERFGALYVGEDHKSAQLEYHIDQYQVDFPKFAKVLSDAAMRPAKTQRR